MDIKSYFMQQMIHFNSDCLTFSFNQEEVRDGEGQKEVRKK